MAAASAALRGPRDAGALSSFSSRCTLFARVRLAAPSDVPHIHKMIHQMAIFEHLADHCTAAGASLSSTLFKSPPFQSFTVLLLEVSHLPFNPFPPPQNPNAVPAFAPIVHTISLDLPIEGPETQIFASGAGGGGAVVAGSVMFFPYYIEDLFVRECYRRKGLGRLLLTAVASQAARMGYGMVEWAESKATGRKRIEGRKKEKKKKKTITKYKKTKVALARSFFKAKNAVRALF